VQVESPLEQLVALLRAEAAEFELVHHNAVTTSRADLIRIGGGEIAAFSA